MPKFLTSFAVWWDKQPKFLRDFAEGAVAAAVTSAGLAVGNADLAHSTATQVVALALYAADNAVIAFARHYLVDQAVANITPKP